MVQREATSESVPSPLAGAWLRNLAAACLGVGTLCSGAWVLGFWSLVVHANWITGEWPRAARGALSNYEPSTIDPKALGLHSELVWFALPFMLYSIPLALLCLLASAPIRSLRQDPRLAIAFLAFVTLTAATIFLNPGDYFRWYMD